MYMILGVLLWALQSDPIEAQIERLGDEKIEVREEAAARLRAAGAAAKPALLTALASADSEIRTRASDLLGLIVPLGPITRIWTLSNADPSQVGGVLRSFRQNGFAPDIAVDLRTRCVVVRGAAEEMRFAERVIAELDAPTVETVTFVVRGCADAETVARTLRELVRSLRRAAH